MRSSSRHDLVRVVARRMRDVHRNESGQVMFFMVFAILVLAALVFFVFNGGDQVNSQVVVQNSADAAAIGGGLWVARGYNLIAMNNVATTKLIALAAMLEAVGPAIELSYPNAVAVAEYYQTYPKDCWNPAWNGLVLTREMWDQYEKVRYEAQTCRAILEELHDWLEQMDSKYAGFPAYFTQFESGVLWQAARGLNDFSHIMVQLMPSFAQARTIQLGRVNGADSAFLAPIYPLMPVYKGTWLDFYDPVMFGLPPDCTDGNKEYTIGGYHTLLGYSPGRSYILSHSVTDPDVRAQLRGPFRHFRAQLFSGVMDELRLSGFPHIFARIAQAKMDAIWNDVPNPVWVPRWVFHYETCNENGGDGARQIHEKHGQFVGPVRPITVVSIWANSRRNRACGYREVDFGVDGDELKPTRWVALEPYEVVRTYYNPDVPSDAWHYKSGEFVDYQCPNDVYRNQRWVWWKETRRRSYEPQDVGTPTCPPNGTGAGGRPYWEFNYYYKNSFGGALMDLELHDTVNNERLMGDKSAYYPILLDTTQAGIQERYRLGVWEFIAFATDGGHAKLWSRVFRNPNPAGKNIAYTQVRVHNPSSWDLWTQNWQAKFVPASQIRNVDVDGFADGIARYQAWRSNLSAADVEPVVTLYHRLPDESQAVIDAINNH